MAARSKMDDFDVVSRLGAGSFGTVYKVLRHQDQGVYVMKTVRISELSDKEQWEAINEVKLLASMDSPFVVRYYDSFINKENLAIIMEFCNKGDLARLIKKAKSSGVTSLLENVIWNISLQILLGLYYLHSKKVLHRDLKSANVFLAKDPSQKYFSVKIGDLGVAKLLDTSTAFAKTIVGTPYYLSPELCSDQPYRDKSDVWAFGVILYECCAFRHPFQAGNQCALILKIIQSAVPSLPDESEISHEIYTMIQWALQKDPTSRPTVRDILCEKVVQRHLREHRFELPDDVPVHEGGSQHRRIRSEAEPPRATVRNSTAQTTKPRTTAPMQSSTELRPTRVRGTGKVSTTAGAKVVSSSRARNIHQKQTAPSTNSTEVVNRLYPGGRERKDTGSGASGGSTPIAMGTDMSHKVTPEERDLLENLNPAPGKHDYEHDLGYGEPSGDEEEYADEKFEQLDDDENDDSGEGERRNSEGGDDGDGLELELEGGLNFYGQYRSPSAKATGDEDFKAAEQSLASLNNTGLLPSHSKMVLPAADQDQESELFVPPSKSSVESMYVTLADPAAIDAVQQKEVLEKMLSDARARSIASLGKELFSQLYTLCMEHMSDSPASIRDTGSGSFKHDEGSDVMLHTDARLIHRLEEAVCNHLNGSIEAACEAVLGIKVILALEARLDNFDNR